MTSQSIDGWFRVEDGDIPHNVELLVGIPLFNDETNGYTGVVLEYNDYGIWIEPGGTPPWSGFMPVIWRRMPEFPDPPEKP